MVQQMTEERVTQSPVKELPIRDFYAIEFYVGNAKQAAHYYRHVFGFDIKAYKGPETGHRDTCSYLLEQNNIRFKLTAALDPDHPVARHVHCHGDGVKDIGFLVTNVEEAYAQAIERGATSVMAPYTEIDPKGTVTKATIKTYGDTTHTFVDRSQYTGLYEPGYVEHVIPGKPVGLHRVDHIVGNVEEGRMDEWVAFYENIFGFYVMRHYDENDISTQYSALVSKVMANRSGTVKMPINEPAKGIRKSQIQEYIDFYKSAGAQHIAISTPDIIATVAALRERGVDLMTVPAAYYQSIADRVGPIRESLEELAKLGILVDREEDGYLLQIFTQPVQDRPTFFFEIIQRQGAQGFGKGNFKALFEAIERDQALRGNL